MTAIFARIVDGVATSEPDMIEFKECPKCAKTIKRRARHCPHCKYNYPEDDFAAEQKAFAKHEAQMKRQEAEVNRD